MSVYTVTVIIFTYLLCSINPAIVICKKKTGQDIRKLGSGNAGSANAMRVLGKPLGILVVMLDIIKVVVSYAICIMLAKIFQTEWDIWHQSIFMVVSVVGHCFPIYYGFRGGKGVIVGMTTIMLLNSKIALICMLVGIIVIAITRIVSLGTLVGLVTYMVLAIFKMSEFLIPMLIITVIVLWKHRANIQRLVSKQEARLW